MALCCNRSKETWFLPFPHINVTNLRKICSIKFPSSFFWNLKATKFVFFYFNSTQPSNFHVDWNQFYAFVRLIKYSILQW